jgi:hypothetical protein
VRRRTQQRPMTKVEKYHKIAVECREEADKAIRPIDRAHWLELAEQWVRMAHEAARHPDAF